MSTMSVSPAGSGGPCSLYVGDLHPEITDGVLYEAFSQFKSLTSVRVCRDSSTGRSLRYGYVNLMSLQDAIRAIEVKNLSLLHGTVIRVMWSLRDPDTRRNGKGNVFVKNLSDLVDSVVLRDMFKIFGTVLSCKVAMSDDGKSKCYGFVQFESEDAANAAIEKLNGSTVGDKQIYVGKFIKKSDRVLGSLDAKYTNLYIKNLDPEVEEVPLLAEFRKFGNIDSAAIAKDENGKSKGFAFVNFVNPDDAKRALEAMNGSQLGSKTLYVARAQKKSERELILRHHYEEKRKEQMLKYKGSNVYVKNIDDAVTDEELREHFSQCGTITSAKIMRSDRDISRGFGFVCFSSPEEAAKAVNTFHGIMFRGKPLYVAFAQRKEDRQAQLRLQFARIAGAFGSSTALIPGAYPSYYYAAPSGAVPPPMPPQQGLMYQPMGLKPSWTPNALDLRTRPGFHPSPLPTIPNPRQPRPNRGRINGQTVPFAQHPQLPHQPIAFTKDSSNQQRYPALQRNGEVNYIPNARRQRDMNKSSGVSPAASNSAGIPSVESELLNSMLGAASPQQQKQIIGERLYPLVQNRKPDLAAKITGMLLEMDNSELLLLLESPESLEAKVEEAVKVLKMSKTTVSGQDSLHSNFLSSQVAVN